MFVYLAKRKMWLVSTWCCVITVLHCPCFSALLPLPFYSRDLCARVIHNIICLTPLHAFKLSYNTLTEL